MLNLDQVREEICDIGRRIYNRGYASANDGNISYRIDEKTVLCTPTGVSKGFMKPEDLCVVDMDGNQISGNKMMTSEVRQHITILHHRPDVNAVVHCHPPHATAFGIAREAIPLCVLPEIEINMGAIPMAKYTIPGGQAFADAIIPFIDKSDIIIQANHGTVSVGTTVEKAYFLTEMLDAYCRMLLIARSLGNVEYFDKSETEDLIALKTKLGFKDNRIEKDGEGLRTNEVFRDSWKEIGVGHRAFQPPSFEPDSFEQESKKQGTHERADRFPPVFPAEQEKFIQAIVDRVVQALERRS